MQFSHLSIAALVSVVAASANNTITTDITVTDWVTYCPEETTITLTTCVKDVCGHHEVTVTEPATITVTGECIIPTVVTEVVKPTAQPTTVADVSTYEGAGAKQVVGGLAGLAVVAAML